MVRAARELPCISVPHEPFRPASCPETRRPVQLPLQAVVSTRDGRACGSQLLTMRGPGGRAEMTGRASVPDKAPELPIAPSPVLDPKTTCLSGLDLQVL